MAYQVPLPTIDDLANHLAVDTTTPGLEVMLMSATDLAEQYLNFTFTETVPASVHVGILQSGAYLFTHRGDCDFTAALASSGAFTTLNPYRVEFTL